MQFKSPFFSVPVASLFENFLVCLNKARKFVVNNPGWDPSEIHFIRRSEFQYCFSPDVFFDKDVLEIGGSDGYLASLIKSTSPSSLVSIDCFPTTPSYYRVFASDAFIDGKSLPLASDRFDVIFSSNTFEHIKDLELLFRECARVLRPSGIVICMLPSPTWRIASIFCQLLNLLPPLPHGEHSLTAFDEIARFAPAWWRRKFEDNGFKCLKISSCGYFYAEPRIFPLTEATGHVRRLLAKFFGPSAFVYFVSLGKSSD